MKNKGFIAVLTGILTLLCLYYLSFTFISRSVKQDATEYATDEKGIINSDKKQAYLDSVWHKPVFNLLGISYTYEEVKNSEINLGLDLQGGMHVTLEVSPIDILRGLSGNNQDSSFVKALNKASQLARTSKENFTTLFFEVYRQDNPGKKLAPLFATSSTRGEIGLNTSDGEVINVVEKEVANAIDRSYTILRNRIDQFGTSQPTIQKLTGGRIQIEIPGAENPQRVRNLLQGVAKLEFWDVIEPDKLNPALMAINDLLVSEQKTKKSNVNDKTVAEDKEDLSDLLSGDKEKQDTTISDLERNLSAAADSTSSGLDSLQNLNVSPIYALSSPPYSFRYDLKDTAVINRIFKRPDVLNRLPRNTGVFWANKPNKYTTDISETPKLQLYFLDLGRNRKAKLDGQSIVSARNDLDQKGQPAVSMTMNATGTRIWAKWTAEAANKGSRIAIVLDNRVYSAPGVNEEIPYGNSIIQGNFTTEEAKDLANILEAGSLPARTRIVEEGIIGPTLGEAAQQSGIISIVSGLVLVVLFMIAYYAKGGIVADIALVFNIFFLLGILAQPSLATSLTLPGIAGIVLTMGMAVDANVLIYERIKEEMSRGKTIKDAIAAGFDKSFGTILDSNLTTFITGFFLFILGQGPIKGFAITLMVGIVTSFFTAIYISRLFIEWMTRNGQKKNISFETSISKIVKKRKHFEFIKNSRLAYIISSVIIIIGFVLIFFQGLTLGVDFKGGRSYTVSFNKPINATELKVDLTKSFENEGTEVKNYGGNNVMKVTTSYLASDESHEADEKVKQALITGLEEKFPGMKYTSNESQVDDTHFAISSSTKVGATVADDIKNSAWKASLFSLLGIFIYILIRFHKWQFSAGAVVATVHDTLFVFAAFGIAGFFGIPFEIDQVFVAAVLTIIGYSINDTVIIFDRIREYSGMGSSHDRPTIFNDAINDTLSRTIITAGTVLLTVVVLLLFGGEVLRGFSFALFIGVVVGTYSSIFVASSVVLDLDKKEKQVGEAKKAIA